MKRLSIHAFVLVALGAVASDCVQPNEGTQAQFDSVSVGWSSRGAGIERSLGVLKARRDALPKDAVGRASVDVAVKANEVALVALQNDFGKVKADAVEVFKFGTEVDKGELMDHAKELNARALELDATIAEEKVILADAQEKADKSAKDAAVATDAGRVAAANDAARELALKSLARDGGDGVFGEIQFVEGSAGFDLSKRGTLKTLDGLVAFASTCSALRFEIIGHTGPHGDARANQKLSEDRAVSVKAYLIDHNVDAGKVTATTGAGGTHPLVDEPEPGSAAAKALDPTMLAVAREKNRRIVIHVLKKCG